MMERIFPSPYHDFLSTQAQVRFVFLIAFKSGTFVKPDSGLLLQNILPQSLSNLITLDNLGLDSERNYVRV